MRGKKNSIAGAASRPGAMKGGRKPVLGKPDSLGKIGFVPKGDGATKRRIKPAMTPKGLK